MKIAVGADKYGYQLKEAVKAYLQRRGIEVEDFGVMDSEGQTAYYEIAASLAKGVSSGKFERGILVCGTGMGMAIIANKQPGVYAAVCENRLAAERARSINDSNILTLGGFVTTAETASEIVDAWLTTQFTQGWEKPIAEWLENSKADIRRIETESFGSKGEEQ
jgi:ribose 5-phosphate isomerase B